MNKWTLRKKIKFITIALLSLLMFISCATVSNVGVDNWRDYYKSGHSKEEIARNFNIYWGRWWNYYARGRWFAEGGYYDEASQDFQKAISLRSKDQRSARSYGMHFFEYYAHRELGIVYYDQGKYEEAKRELEISLSTADSARAKYYLNKSNEAILKMTKRDQEPPKIQITSHTNGEIVNTPVAKLKGVATDDFYVRGINIQGEKLFIELAEKDIAFNEDISLHTGLNEICLEATDLSGKSTHQNLKLTLDMRPPILYLDDMQIEKRNGKNIANVKGTIVDDNGVKHLYINNTEIAITPNKEVDFKQDVALTDGHKISFKVVDVAGNETKAEEQFDTKASLWLDDILDNTKHAYRTKNTPVVVAASNLDKTAVKRLLASYEANVPPSKSSSSENPEDKEKGDKEPHTIKVTVIDNIPPVIHTDLKSAVVQDANLFFSIHAHDDSGVAKLFANQYPLEIRPGKNIFFNYSLPLTDGDNIVTVKAIDTQGNETQLSPVKITKRTFELLQTDARYTVAWLPLRTFANKVVSSDTLYSMLLNAFDEEPKRFNFVEGDRAKIEAILREQKISNTELTSPDTAVKIGKLRAAEGIFSGAVEEDAQGINVTLQLVDTETRQVLAHVDVYDEDKSIKNLEWLMHGLSLKMKRQFPMIQGNVIHVSGGGFHFDAGETSGLKLGMKLLLFREIKEGNFVLKEPLDTIARIVLVQPETSFAKISRKGAEKIKKKDLVITK